MDARWKVAGKHVDIEEEYMKAEWAYLAALGDDLVSSLNGVPVKDWMERTTWTAKMRGSSPRRPNLNLESDRYAVQVYLRKGKLQCTVFADRGTTFDIDPSKSWVDAAFIAPRVNRIVEADEWKRYLDSDRARM